MYRRKREGISQDRRSASQADALRRALEREWFYEFDLPSGGKTRSYLPADVVGIHQTRLNMVLETLDAYIGRDWSTTTCIDLACHEGYFAVALAQRACRDVLGIDVREDNLTGARLVRDLFGLANLRFKRANLLNVRPEKIGTFDIVLMLGVLYHVENPVLALRQARALTRRICLVETQLGPSLSGSIEWGAASFTKSVVGTLTLVDETSESSGDNREANITSISFAPDLSALLFLMSAVGFHHIAVITPPHGANEQFARGKRALVAGYVD